MAIMWGVSSLGEKHKKLNFNADKEVSMDKGLRLLMKLLTALRPQTWHKWKEMQTIEETRVRKVEAS